VRDLGAPAPNGVDPEANGSVAPTDLAAKVSLLLPSLVGLGVGVSVTRVVTWCSKG
jgi:hypothetical protein